MKVRIVVDPVEGYTEINSGRRTLSLECYGHPDNNRLLARGLRRYADFLEEHAKACQDIKEVSHVQVGRPISG